MEKRWVVLNENGKDLRRVLIENRNIRDPDSFFKPHLYKLTSPSKLFPDLEKAVERIKKAIKNKELVYIYGDFDADGITGTAILWETIDLLGGKVLPFIPHRVKEGYGLHAQALKSLAKEGAKVIISVDCGVTAVDEAEISKKLSVDLIITDHHPIKAVVPDPFALLHDENLAGSGVAFMLAKALLESFAKSEEKQLFKNLELATIGTIADIVSLVGDNRIIAANGLHNLSASNRIGLRALYEEAAIAKRIGPYEVGFIIVPRLNAAGRMEHALDSLRLLLTRNRERARQLAVKLSETNRRRQEALEGALAHARQGVQAGKLPKIIIVQNKTYPAGVIGLVAARLAEEFYRPAIVIAEGETCKGSARSICGFDIAAAIAAAAEHLETYGGHPMAAGFSVTSTEIRRFKEKILDYAEKTLKGTDLTPTLNIDTGLDGAYLNPATLELVREFEPFGTGNPEPIFLTKNLQVIRSNPVGRGGRHTRFVFRTPANFIVDGIGFGLGDRKVGEGQLLDTVYNLKEDTWQGNGRLELKIKDFRLAGS
ncbi:MAG: single-stranded-DNA-specific exonuclease RecJ [Candidatus Woykebacteria bacterium GWB1_45_5]|uniref:Single-stranded-DNA-specific exonuclease RecJ n=2 Tax=Candidatus Woykeibacteriota TaxID=1817899 RepID=A0A1G1W2H1_9BACT|nr:MAG: single-stranded-DNA-specific exonuclease RecJ [Candidatus Woykebacteria bacterium GWA1_44_8]OGY22820.1 MAG: single-stranded-DNA-specific exonuclease RecJ [Candidatus Woykebacteria bacterium GWB1_45_5]